MMRTDRHSDERDGRRKDRRPSDVYGDRISNRHSKEIHHRSERHRDDILRDRDYHGPSERLTNMSSNEAINALLRDTKKASASLSGVKDDFDRDIRGVRTYASPELLNDLWISKMEPGHGSRTKDRPSQSQNKGERQPSKPDLKETAEVFYQSLRSAIAATRVDPEPAVNRKLENAKAEMVGLLRVAPRKFGALNALLTELELLAVFLERNGVGKKSRHGITRRSKDAHRQDGRHEDSQESPRADKYDDDPQRGNDSDRDDDRDDSVSREDNEPDGSDRDQRDEQVSGGDDRNKGTIRAFPLSIQVRHKTDLQ